MTVDKIRVTVLVRAVIVLDVDVPIRNPHRHSICELFISFSHVSISILERAARQILSLAQPWGDRGWPWRLPQSPGRYVIAC